MKSATTDIVTALVPALGTAGFERLFYAKTREIFGNQQCNVFVLRDGLPAECMLTHAADRTIRQLTRSCASLYLKHGTEADPILSDMRRRRTDKSPLVRRITAQDINDQTYRERFYDNAAVSQKLATLSRTSDKVFYLNLYRDPSQPDYSAEDRGLLHEHGETLCAMLAKHYELTHQEVRLATPRLTMSDEFRAELSRQVRNALLSEAAGLTEKEADICAAIAIGQTASGIALDHAISTNTVATHRKRAYAKLGISSQSELFARYYESLTNRALSAARSA